MADEPTVDNYKGTIKELEKKTSKNGKPFMKAKINDKYYTIWEITGEALALKVGDYVEGLVEINGKFLNIKTIVKKPKPEGTTTESDSMSKSDWAEKEKREYRAKIINTMLMGKFSITKAHVDYLTDIIYGIEPKINVSFESAIPDVEDIMEE